MWSNGGLCSPKPYPHRYDMRLQDISALAGSITQVTFTRNETEQWEVSIFLGGAASQEHKLTKFHHRDTPRTWASLDKAVAMLEQQLGVKFELTSSLQKKVAHEPRENPGDG